jgi:hypothetical protein
MCGECAEGGEGRVQGGVGIRDRVGDHGLATGQASWCAFWFLLGEI